MGLKSKLAGDFGESVARSVLQQMGVKMIERVHTPWRIVRVGKRIVSAHPKEKVCGDFIGIYDGGKKVLAEAKYRPRKLSICDLEDHQIIALNDNNKFGALSLLIWVHEKGCNVYNWPNMMLKKEKPITPNNQIGLIYNHKF